MGLSLEGRMNWWSECDETSKVFECSRVLSEFTPPPPSSELMVLAMSDMVYMFAMFVCFQF
jgi:hypothetical protein